MYALLIDTHDKIINLVLYKDDEVIDLLTKQTEKSHSIFIIPLIDQLLTSNKVNKHNITQIIVVNGPGSFTGVRIGITIAKTWAYTQKIKIKTISSLQVLACSLKQKEKKVAIPDPKGFYIGSFTENNKPLGEYQYATNCSDDYILEQDIKVDYKLVYEFLKDMPALNPHAVNPIYIKKIGVEQ